MNIFIQVKNEDRGGVFIDYDGSSAVEDKSVIRVVCMGKTMPISEFCTADPFWVKTVAF